MAYIFDLPEEILLKIFKFYIEIEKQRKLISCIGEVCKQWRRLSVERDLWYKCDGSLTNHQLSKLCKSGNMRHVKELILGKKTNMKSLPELFRYLSNLKSIDFSNVKCVTSDCMSSLGEHIHNLREIKFSRNLNYAHYSISPKFMYNFLEFRGAYLIVLDISHTDISCLSKLLLLVSKSCFCLQELLIYNVQIHGGSKFPLDAVQNGCPNIKVLRLDFQIAFTNHQTAQLPGFPALEVFTRSSVDDCYFSDQELNNVLFRSSQLKVLDIRGCKRISIGAILSLPATDLEKLFISYTNLHSTERLSEILEKWNESLSILDLSRMKSRFFDAVLINIFSGGRLPKLECLDLNNTNVSAKAVIMIIQNCENLAILNLTSCRNVGRGFMRNHCGKMELKKLLDQLSDISYVEVM